MKKLIIFSIFSLIILSFFLSGCTTCNKPYIKVGNECCLDNNDNSICDVDENIAKEAPKEETLANDEYQFKINEGKDFPNYMKYVKLISVDNEGKIVVEVEDTKSKTVVSTTREIKETKYMEIIDGLEIINQRINFDIDPNKIYVILKINKYTEKPDEYLVNIDKPITVKGNTITFKEVDPKDHSIQISVNGKNYIRIREGYTENIEELQITNVKAFPRDVRYENYAILRII